MEIESERARARKETGVLCRVWRTETKEGNQKDENEKEGRRKRRREPAFNLEGRENEKGGQDDQEKRKRVKDELERGRKRGRRRRHERERKQRSKSKAKAQDDATTIPPPPSSSTNPRLESKTRLPEDRSRDIGREEGFPLNLGVSLNGVRVGEGIDPRGSSSSSSSSSSGRGVERTGRSGSLVRSGRCGCRRSLVGRLLVGVGDWVGEGVDCKEKEGRRDASV